MEFLHLSSKQYRQMLSLEKTGKANKYNAKKTEADGIVFDSSFEAKKWEELKTLERIGFIKDLEIQIRFILQDGYINNKGKKIRPISYIADFVYYDIKKKKRIVMDTKSPATRTAEYLLKKKMFEYRYPEYLFEEVIKKPSKK